MALSWGELPNLSEGPAECQPLLLFIATRGLGQTCPRVTDEDTGSRTKFQGSLPLPEDGPWASLHGKRARSRKAVPCALFAAMVGGVIRT